MADVILKTLADLPVVEPNESTHLLAEQNGAYTRIPKDKVGGSNIPMTRGLKKYVYDGDTTGRETVEVQGMSYVRIMDDVLSADDMIGGSVTLSAEGVTGTLEITNSSLSEVAPITLVVAGGGIPALVLCAQDNYEMQGVVFNKGVYILGDAAAMVTAFTYYGEVIVEDVFPASILSNPGVFVVRLDSQGTMDNPTYTADKTCAEIMAAWAEGKLPVAWLPYMVMPIAALTESAVYFGCVGSLSGTYAVGTARVGADGTVSYSNKEI